MAAPSNYIAKFKFKVSDACRPLFSIQFGSTRVLQLLYQFLASLLDQPEGKDLSSALPSEVCQKTISAFPTDPTSHKFLS